MVLYYNITFILNKISISHIEMFINPNIIKY